MNKDRRVKIKDTPGKIYAEHSFMFSIFSMNIKHKTM